MTCNLQVIEIILPLYLCKWYQKKNLSYCSWVSLCICKAWEQLLHKSDMKFHITIIYYIILKSHGIMIVNITLVFLKMFSVAY